MTANGTLMKQHLPTPAMTAAPLPNTGFHTSQAVLKLMQFSDRLSPGNEATELSTWTKFVDEFFTRSGSLRFTLWNASTEEKRLHTISRPSIARIFQTQYECGVTSLQLTMDQTNEYFLDKAMLLECPRSSFIYRYENGSLVILFGVLSVVLVSDSVSGSLKIEKFDFECSKHEEFVARQNINIVSTPAKKKGKKPPPSILPDSPVSEWGVPARILQLMLISDTAATFSEIAFTAITTVVPPAMALKIRANFAQQHLMELHRRQQQQQQQQLQQQQQQQQQQQGIPGAAVVPQPTGFYPGASIPMGGGIQQTMSGPVRMPSYTNMQQMPSSPNVLPNAVPNNATNYAHVPSPLGSSPVITNKRKPVDNEDEEQSQQPPQQQTPQPQQPTPTKTATPRKKKAARKG
ncbi:LIM-domain binding protein-domain-containing protein [Zychaea mexicana]|uniref:LIM-domain binding protein-domain-containing protein n=1 Tax=Zychaea mexicana TaxID=64656 RepID=UPI0022FEFE6C|nr:LIM-domain binding protein-domain-containing protein [Zychaea mexicana]KAI9493667.1 LIM-domain binding protein-domain-containing protein [Zychaea mexicana]